MAGNTLGNYFKVTTFGESHGPAIGALIDGCPAGLDLTEDDFCEAMRRRNPDDKFTTQRSESDKVNILSGVFNGKTTGTPICLVIYNNSFDSAPYDEIKDIYRPGHADYTCETKYGIRDYRGGGRASGRETASRVMAGVVAAKILNKFGIGVSASVISIGGLDADKADEILNLAKSNGDSLGGITKCIIKGVYAGIGDPVFDKLDAKLSQAMLSIPGAKGFEIGDGYGITSLTGSQANDAFTVSDGKIGKLSNHSGGVLGGISDGDDIVFTVAFKPTPSIMKEQKTVSKNMEETSVKINGKHDCCYCLRTPVIVEAMASIVLCDLILSDKLSQIENLI